jgi:hypothetical protein
MLVKIDCISSKQSRNPEVIPSCLKITRISYPSIAINMKKVGRFSHSIGVLVALISTAQSSKVDNVPYIIDSHPTGYLHASNFSTPEDMCLAI